MAEQEHAFSVGAGVVRVGHVSIGGPQKVLLCGPCVVESQSQIEQTAAFLSRLGVPIMRGGAYKPRTSPRSFHRSHRL